MRLSIHLGVQIASLIDDAGSKPAPWVSTQNSPAHETHCRAPCVGGDSFYPTAFRHIASLQEQAEDLS